MSSETTSARKWEHVRIIEDDPQADRQKYFFDRIHLTHRALPEISMADVNPSLQLLNRKLTFPLLISSMTGGDHDVLRRVNHNLALAAEATGVAMGVGSQRVMFTHPAARDSFELRAKAPSALLFANLGAIQLNNGFGPEHCQQAVDTVGADACYLHLNPLQEAIQPEGNTNFAQLSHKIEQVTGALNVPVAVKEVGAGISLHDAEVLVNTGVSFIDVAGSGGLSWSRIEHHRRAPTAPDQRGLLFQDWGLPTPWALNALAPLQGKVTLFASGGIRNGVDMIKAVILGATLCGMASPLLAPAMESVEKVIAVIEQLKQEFRTAMFLLGAKTLDDVLGHKEWIVHADFPL